MIDRPATRGRAGPKGAAAASGKSPGNVMDDPEQSARFIKAARELGIDEVGERYERALNRILAAPKPSEPAPQPVADPDQKRRGRPRKMKPD